MGSYTCKLRVQRHQARLIALPATSSRLRQGRLSLGEPESHPHGTVDLKRCRQCGARLLPLAGPGVQRPEATVAVRLQPDMPERCSHGQGALAGDHGTLHIACQPESHAHTVVEPSESQLVAE